MWRAGQCVSTRSIMAAQVAASAAWQPQRALKSNRAPRDQDFGAGEGNRTLVVSLEGFCSTIELHPLAMQRRAQCHWPSGIVNRIGSDGAA
jgi:hypothetical protein